MKALLLVPIVLLASALSAQAQINTMAINWSNFKGAKVVRTLDEHDNTKVTLNEKGMVSTMETFWQGLPFSKTTYKYDEQGRIVEQKRTPMSAEDKRGTVVCTYHYAGNTCDEQRMWDNGVVFERIVSNLNSKGLKTSEIHYNEDGSEGRHYEFEYDSRGNQTLIKCSGADKDAVYAKAGPKTIINRLKYDDHNNPVSFEVSYDAEGASSVQNFSYTYDTRGNWTKRTATFSHTGSKDVQQSKTEIAITY